MKHLALRCHGFLDSRSQSLLAESQFVGRSNFSFLFFSMLKGHHYLQAALVSSLDVNLICSKGRFPAPSIFWLHVEIAALSFSDNR